MLRANVGISRKMSENYNSTGYSINLDGEILATPDDPEAVVERIRELYNLAEEALDRQIAEFKEINALAGRDAEDRPGTATNGRPDGHQAAEAGKTPPSGDGHRDVPQNGEPATNKQIQFLLTLAKRQKLAGAKLEARIGQVVGRACSPYDLTKREAGQVIEDLNPEAAESDRPRR